MTRLDFEYIKDAFSQIIDDIAGNPDWHDATRAVASDIGTLEKLLEKRVVELPNELEEAAEEYLQKVKAGFLRTLEHPTAKDCFKDGAKWDREQMMKEAVDAIVEDWNPDPEPEITIPLNPEEFTRGDKVRVIVLPKED